MNTPRTPAARTQTVRVLSEIVFEGAWRQPGEVLEMPIEDAEEFAASGDVRIVLRLSDGRRPR